MIISQLENQLIENSITFAQQQVLTPANLGIFKSGTKDKLLETLDGININLLVGVKTRDQFDKWFDTIIYELHMDLLPAYRSNLVIKGNNPYSYTARILTHYLKILYFRVWFFGADTHGYIKMLHPIISNTFIKAFQKIRISRVNQINNRDEYYQIIEFYRALIDQDLCGENKSLMTLQIGVEV